MKYTMKAGALCAAGSNRVLARLKGGFLGPEKKIFTDGGQPSLSTAIRDLPAPPEQIGNARYREYVIFDGNGNEYATARPGYADGDDPDTMGWPVCRMPRVDHAQVTLDRREYLLVMRSSQNYILAAPNGQAAAQIIHRGLMGGWDIEASGDLQPEELCGIFVLCRYIEQENELVLI